MDRNSLWAWMGGLNYNVALRKESVDRNQATTLNRYHFTTSLSARRAWIEIGLSGVDTVSHQVALRKESVDRNKYIVQCRKVLGVALRKESVDRNWFIWR